MPSVDLTREGAVAVVTLNAPGWANALVPEMAAELIHVVDEIDADPAIGAAIIRGAGDNFCSGAHRDVLAKVGQDPAEPTRYGMTGAVYEAFYRVGQLGVPSIAAVRGAAVGAGMNLALSTDLRIVATDARLTAGFMRIGIHPGGGFFVIGDRTMRREATAALGLFGEVIDGTRAERIGLAWRAVPSDEVETTAMELAAVAAKDPELARRTVRSFRQELGPPTVSWDVALEAERASQMWSLRRRAAAGDT
ncbi:MAG: enoyl-CoA hydratase/isomerase family protein [Actinophytocola sp.]|nr:enoyl-CoA hydratase/isomerase family protein [Actinophytocola sp.]